MIYIYGLIDPRTSVIRYVGKSIRPKERLTNHCNERSVTWRTNWLKELKQVGLRPELKIIEELPDEADWQAKERFWIAEGKRLGWPLTNCTDGGDGVPGLPAETRARMRLTWLGRKHRPESLLKISAASRRRKHSEAQRNFMSKKMKGRAITWREQLRIAVSKFTQEQVAEITARLKAGELVKALAVEYSVHRTTISKIKKGSYFQDARDRQKALAL